MDGYFALLAVEPPTPTSIALEALQVAVRALRREMA